MVDGLIGLLGICGIHGSGGRKNDPFGDAAQQSRHLFQILNVAKRRSKGLTVSEAVLHIPQTVVPVDHRGIGAGAQIIRQAEHGIADEATVVLGCIDLKVVAEEFPYLILITQSDGVPQKHDFGFRQRKSPPNSSGGANGSLGARPYIFSIPYPRVLFNRFAAVLQFFPRGTSPRQRSVGRMCPKYAQKSAAHRICMIRRAAKTGLLARESASLNIPFPHR